jgi:hypothetical protein
VPGDVGEALGAAGCPDAKVWPDLLEFPYTQNAEDVVLSRVFADQEFGFSVDISACHPVEDSVTLHFYERGWHGVNVEPDRELHALFLEAARATSICAPPLGGPRGRLAFHPTGPPSDGPARPWHSRRDLGFSPLRWPAGRMCAGDVAGRLHRLSWAR